jgi:heptaprenylglyceryl phosphate synthase
MQTLEELAKWHDDCALVSTSRHATERHTTAAATIRAAMGEVEQLQRCLLPVWMTIAEHEMAGEPLADDVRVLSFMGSGASDFVTAGEVRAAIKKGPAHD